MTIPYHSIINYQEDEWKEFLEKLLLVDIFMPVINEFSDVNDLKCAIRYIVYSYSSNSDKIVVGMEWLKNKEKIFDFVCARPIMELKDKLVLLKSEKVVETIHNWLNFQDQKTFTQMMVYKDLMIEMQLSANSPIKKSSSEIDFDQKFKNAEYAASLKKKIHELEQELIQNDAKLKDAIKELSKIRKGSGTVGVESFAK
jgi:hypothetical protein